MDWQIDPRRQMHIRRLTSTMTEVIGRFTTPSDSILPSLATFLPVIDLFNRYGQADWVYAPACIRVTEGKVRKVSKEIWDWTVKEGLIVAIERNGAVVAYRTSDAWHDWILAHASPSISDLSIDWSKLDLVFQKYGRLGLRIASQLAFGNSHAIDNLKIPDAYRDKIWVWRDAVPSGANVIRLGGCLSIQTPYASYSNRWIPPGHFLWSWDVDEIFPDKLKVGSKILVVENPYAFWHLLSYFAEQDWMLVCLHGETRQSGFLDADADLHRLFQLIVNNCPQATFQIWCDPDPGGLVMATNAIEIIQNIGGKASFCMMDRSALDRIESLVISDQKLLPLDDQDVSILKRGPIHKNLMPLAQEIQKRQQKGEQECLALVFQPNNAQAL